MMVSLSPSSSVAYFSENYVKKRFTTVVRIDLLSGPLPVTSFVAMAKPDIILIIILTTILVIFEVTVTPGSTFKLTLI